MPRPNRPVYFRINPAIQAFLETEMLRPEFDMKLIRDAKGKITKIETSFGDLKHRRKTT